MDDLDTDEMYSRAVLGVELNASKKEIEKAFRKKAFKSHPDKLNVSKESKEYLEGVEYFLDLTNARDYLLALLVPEVPELPKNTDQSSQDDQREKAYQSPQVDEYQHKGVGIGERNGPHINGEWRADKDFRWDEEAGIFKSPGGKTFYCEKFEAENFIWKYDSKTDTCYRVQRIHSGSKPTSNGNERLNNETCFPESLFSRTSKKPSEATKNTANRTAAGKINAASKKPSEATKNTANRAAAGKINDAHPHKRAAAGRNDDAHHHKKSKPSNTTKTNVAGKTNGLPTYMKATASKVNKSSSTTQSTDETQRSSSTIHTSYTIPKKKKR
jgi:curved DNA-binding protein CbpA